MKKFFIVSSLLLTLMLSGINVFAANNPGLNSKATESLEQNLINGINSENEGLKTSAAYYLGEMKSSKAVVPLLKMMHNEKSEGARIMAALSLLKIGDDRGIYAIKQNCKFDESTKVRKMCELFYSNYLQEQKNQKK